ncbi:hypothetical protein RE628_05870 [Paenibacillus sp. D2_2]|uniref:hypothetical protein n=1 Tax=Paenibacillus sp. D2_2 TaxID=3073092 RepID=UPI00281530ED|nr:hypothetical protein [Paenibacillus sp. D2_2]WMT41965.1 hypothetical protein RE628_05870 [Paenibacillus sp. D2_2]
MLQDQFIDSIYALRTDDQLWSVYNDDKLFPGLMDIASVHNKVKDRYSKWYYALKKDQTLWAWEDNLYSLPKLVVFTKGMAAGYRSGTLGQPTGDQTRVTGTPTGDHSGQQPNQRVIGMGQQAHPSAVKLKKQPNRRVVFLPRETKQLEMVPGLKLNLLYGLFRKLAFFRLSRCCSRADNRSLPLAMCFLVPKLRIPLTIRA